MGLPVQLQQLSSLPDTAMRFISSARTSNTLSTIANITLRPSEAILSVKCFMLARRFHQMATAKNHQGKTGQAIVNLVRATSFAATGVFLAVDAVKGAGVGKLFTSSQANAQANAFQQGFQLGRDRLLPCIKQGCNIDINYESSEATIACPKGITCP